MFNRFMNTANSLGAIAATDINNGPDVEGLQKADGEPNVNTGGYHAVDGVEEGNGLEDDNTPAVSALTVQVSHPAGQAEPQSDITVRVHTGTGWQNKRLVLTGHLTALKLAKVIAGCGDW